MSSGSVKLGCIRGTAAWRAATWLASAAALLILPSCASRDAKVICAGTPPTKIPPHIQVPPPPPAQGIIWLNHQDLSTSPSSRVDIGTNGTQVFVSLKPNLTFANPESMLIGLYPSAISPGLHITGVRACYAIIGNHPLTKVHRLRLAQFESHHASGPPPKSGYIVRLEASNVAALSPVPPASGFAYGDAAGFLCVDSSPAVCLDPTAGTIGVDVGVQFGDPDDRLVFDAIGLAYDRDCAPVTSP